MIRRRYSPPNSDAVTDRSSEAAVRRKGRVNVIRQKSPTATRILFVTQYFPPEPGAPSARVHECARQWVKDGLDVTVLTTMPSHPTGVVPKKYRGKLYCRETVDGIDIRRAYIYATPNRGVWRRSLCYVTFLISAVVAGLFCRRRPDVLVATSPQLLSGFAGWVLAKLMRVPFVFEVRDLWPQSITAVGATLSPWLLKPLYALASFLYRAADRIVLTSESAKDELEKLGVPAEKMTVVKNGVDLSVFHESPHENWVHERMGFNSSFVLLYIGTIGMAHGLDVVIAAAEELKDDPHVVFMLVGEGARKAELKSRARHLPNVVFADACPHCDVADYLAAADACLVHLMDTDLFKTVLPSKMFEMMGCCKPILLGVGGEARRTLEAAGAGIAFPPGDDVALVRELQRLRRDPRLSLQLGQQGRRFVEQNHSRTNLARRYANLLRELA